LFGRVANGNNTQYAKIFRNSEQLLYVFFRKYSFGIHAVADLNPAASSPSDWAVSCSKIEAIEQSSTQTSFLVLSAQITTASGAVSSGVAPCGLHNFNWLIFVLSLTKTNSQGFIFFDDGERSSASFSSSKFFSFNRLFGVFTDAAAVSQ
jgi:hypothetical protein